MFGYLRLFLALLVVSSHLNASIIKFVDQGKAAVFIFYVLAGLVTTKLYLEVFNKNVKAFMKDRFLRIFPMAWAWLIISFIVIYLVYPESLIISAKKLFYHFSIIPLNYFSYLDVQTLIEPDVSGMNFILPPYFSLGIELQTYFILALFLYFKNMSFLRMAAILSFISFSYVTSFGLGSPQANINFSYVIFTQVFFAFYLGVLIYFKRDKELAFWYLAIIALFIFHFARFSSFGVSPTAQIGLIIFLPIIKLIYKYRDIKLPFNHLLGSFSFIIYLNHMLFIYYIDTDLINISFSWDTFITVVLASVISAIPAYYLIEVQLNKIRRVKER